MSKAICVDELVDMLSAVDRGLMVTVGGCGLSILDDDGDEVDYIAFTEEA